MEVSNKLLRKQSTSHKGQSLPFTLVTGRSNGCFFMDQQPWFIVSRTYLPITYLTRWKERGTIRFIPELVHNLASALALRSPLPAQVSHKRLRCWYPICHGERTEINRLVDPNRRGAYCRRVYNIRIDLRVYRNWALSSNDYHGNWLSLVSKAKLDNPV